MCAAPPGFSQLTTSFVASQTQGIHHVPLVALKKLETSRKDKENLAFTGYCSLLPDHINFRPTKKWCVLNYVIDKLLDTRLTTFPICQRAESNSQIAIGNVQSDLQMSGSRSRRPPFVTRILLFMLPAWSLYSTFVASHSFACGNSVQP